MAKEKKTVKELTPEEKLVRALVPVEEQPYGVPENWCWVRFGLLIELISGRDAALSECNDKGIGIPYILGASNINNNTFSVERWIESPQVISKKNDILLSVKGTIGKLYLQQEDSINISRQIMAIRPLKKLNVKFIYYFLLCICNELQEAGNGLIPGISRSDILEKAFPLPPLFEQQRIVDRIENLFARLDEAKGKAQAVVDGFELRRSAILHKAFTGELTEKWRQTYGKKNSDWHMVRFDEVAEIKSNLVNPADFQDSPHIAPDNIEKKTGILLEYHTIAEDGVKSGKHGFHAGQILYSKIRPYLSKVITVDFDGLCSADMYPINAKEYTRYLWYYMLADEFLVQASNAGSRSVLPKINQKELSKIMVHMTSLEEQQEIVTILDNIFEKEQQAKEAAEAVLAQIDTMKKAILARAFRGELGTNDPEEESAEVLLKQIL